METEEWVPHKRETWPWTLGRLKRGVEGSTYQGNWDKHGPVMARVYVPEGTLVRIVMVSRFGDIGVTPYLDDIRGYVARISFDDIEREP